MINQEQYNKALDFAAKAHGDQKYPGKGYSYIVHLSSVAMEVMAAYMAGFGFDVMLAVQCALLHDTIEDTETSHQQLNQEFGLKIADGVRALTKNETLPKTEQMSDSLERIVTQPVEIAIVKMADRCANLQAPPKYWNIEKRTAYQTEAKLILEELGFANKYLAKRLAERIATYSKFIEK